MAHRRSAKRRSQHKSYSRIPQRDTDAITEIHRNLLGDFYYYQQLRRRSPDVLGDDRRRFRPDDQKDYRKIDGRPVRYRHRMVEEGHKRYFGVYFNHPEVVPVCKRRSERRESLFAKRKIGKGKSGPKKRRYTEKSKVRC